MQTFKVFHMLDKLKMVSSFAVVTSGASCFSCRLSRSIQGPSSAFQFSRTCLLRLLYPGFSNAFRHIRQPEVIFLSPSHVLQPRK